MNHVSQETGLDVGDSASDDPVGLGKVVIVAEGRIGLQLVRPVFLGGEHLDHFWLHLEGGPDLSGVSEESQVGQEYPCDNRSLLWKSSSFLFCDFSRTWRLHVHGDPTASRFGDLAVCRFHNFHAGCRDVAKTHRISIRIRTAAAVCAPHRPS